MAKKKQEAKNKETEDKKKTTNEELVIVNNELQEKIEELSRVNNDISNLLSSTDIGTMFLDENLRIKRFTPAMTKIMNLINSDIGRPISDIVSNIENDQLFIEAKSVLKTLIPLETEVQAKTGNWYLVRLMPYRTVEDVIEGVVVTYVDITKRREDEEALRESEEKFKSLAENSQDYILRYDEAGKHLYMNPAAIRISGWKSEKEWLGKTHRELGFEKDLYLMWEKKIAKVFKTGKLSEEIFSWESTEGIVTLDWRVFPEFDSTGKVKTVLGISRDITKLKESEKTIVKHAEDLEKMVKELKNTQEELVRKEKLATLGELSGGIAHELRSPLTSITNAAYYLNMLFPDGDQDVKENIAIISSEVDRAEKIIIALLDFGRMDALKKVTVSISKLLKQTLDKYPPPKEIKVTVKATASIPDVNVNPIQITQVISNLIENAYQAMPKGGKLIIQVKKINKQVHVSIKDTGIGIAEEDLNKIFEPLISSKVNGIGLGLPISRKFAEVNGSKITVESKVGKGSTFTLIIGRLEL